jgi:hypothetical protein
VRREAPLAFFEGYSTAIAVFEAVLFNPLTLWYGGLSIKNMHGAASGKRTEAR